MVGRLKGIPGNKQILKNAAIFSVTSVILLMNNFSDQYFVVQLGRLQAAAYTLNVPLFWIMVSASAALGAVYSADIKKHLSENDPEGADRAAIRAAVYSVLFGFVFSIISAVFFMLFFQLVPEDDVRIQAYMYMTPMLVMYFVMTLDSVLGGLLNAEGQYKVYVAALLIMLAGNAGFDYIFLHMGIGMFGNGLSTVLGAAISLAFELEWYMRGRTRVKLSFRYFAWSLRSMMAALYRIRKILIRHLTKDISELFIRFTLYLTYTLSYGVPMMYSTLIATIGMGAGAYLSSEYERLLKTGDREEVKALFLRSTVLIMLVTLSIALLFRLMAGVLVEPFVPFDSSKDSFDIMMWTLGILCFTSPFVSMKYLANAVSAPVGRISHATLLLILWATVKTVAFMYLVDISYEYAIYTILVERILSFAVSAVIAVWHIRNTYPKEKPRPALQDTVSLYS